LKQRGGTQEEVTFVDSNPTAAIRGNQNARTGLITVALIQSFKEGIAKNASGALSSVKLEMPHFVGIGAGLLKCEAPPSCHLVFVSYPFSWIPKLK
jgi:hypothetical protein